MSYRRMDSGNSTGLEYHEFTKLLAETESTIRGYDVRLSSSRSTTELRQIRQKLPTIEKNIEVLESSLEMYLANPRKYGVTENQLQPHTQTLNKVIDLLVKVQTGTEKNNNKNTTAATYIPPSRPAEDNEETQYLSNQQLLDEEVSRAQLEDDALDSISHGLTQLNYVAKSQNKQLLKHGVLIDEVRDGMERTDGHLQANIQRANIVEEKTRGGCCSLLIMAVLLALIVSVLVSNWPCHILPKVTKNGC